MLSLNHALHLFLLARIVASQSSIYQLDTQDDKKNAAATLAYDLMSYYHGNESGQTPGLLPGPPPAGDYYWWEAGALWGTMIDYWHSTQDDTYNRVVTQALLFQVGDNESFMPDNVTMSLGNDDQGFWGMSAMQAAEQKFPDPPDDQPQWLALAQGVFNTQASPDRHDDECGGGLRWQIPTYNPGYNYKNSIANGCFFNLGARLARYLKNDTCAHWASKTWNWMRSVGLMDDEYNVYDGGHVEANCTDTDTAQYSYNSAIFLLGAAHMYNYTDGSDLWKERVEGLLEATLRNFFPGDMAFEPWCEQTMTCTTDMLSYKGYDMRWMAQAVQVAPFIASRVQPVLEKSARGAVGQCSGGDDGRTCGFQWTTGVWDGTSGVGQTMNVLGAVISITMTQESRAAGLVTDDNGGTSKGDADAGANSDDVLKVEWEPLTLADQAGGGYRDRGGGAVFTGSHGLVGDGVRRREGRWEVTGTTTMSGGRRGW